MARASIVRSDWDFNVERGPDWLLVRPRRLGHRDRGALTFANQVWALLEQNFTHRLVLEMGDVDPLDSDLVSELLRLYKRIHTHDGVMRLCGLSDTGEEVLRECRLEGQFPRYRNREEAVMGQSHPRQPR
ncbi:MAG: STAS domain-containing protein [Pirellulales bacterium]